MLYKQAALVLAFAMSSAAPITAGGSSPNAPSATTRSASFTRPIAFIPNRGQAPPDVLWLAEGQGFEASFRRDGFLLRVYEHQASAPPAANLRIGPASANAYPAGSRVVQQALSWVGTNEKFSVEALDPQPGKINFLLGNDPRRWLRGLATYARLRYKDVYPGIDLLFYDHDGSLEYDFVVNPGADPDHIRLKLGDGSNARITPKGELQVGEGPEAVLHRPILYQNVGTGKQIITGRFAWASRRARSPSSQTLARS